jgi:hypothetical protein
VELFRLGPVSQEARYVLEGDLGAELGVETRDYGRHGDGWKHAGTLLTAAGTTSHCILIGKLDMSLSPFSYFI